MSRLCPWASSHGQIEDSFICQVDSWVDTQRVGRYMELKYGRISSRIWGTIESSDHAIDMASSGEHANRGPELQAVCHSCIHLCKIYERCTNVRRYARHSFLWLSSRSFYEFMCGPELLRPSGRTTGSWSQPYVPMLCSQHAQ
jgi:hypothetical protein